MPIQYATLGNKSDDSFEHISGDSIRNALKSLQNESTAQKRARSTAKGKTLCISNTVVKLQDLFQDPEEDTGSRALCKKAKPISGPPEQLKQYVQSVKQQEENDHQNTI